MRKVVFENGHFFTDAEPLIVESTLNLSFVLWPLHSTEN